MTAKIRLITGENCHLCDQAKAILNPLLEARKMRLIELSVGDDKVLFERYGLRIPVVIFPDGSEKGWPFTSAQISRMLDRLV